MAKSNMDQDILKVLLSEEEIKARVQEMGDQLYEAFKDKNPMFVGVLNGCFIFVADLVRAAQLKSEVEFIGLSSYKDATKSSGVVQITRDLQRDISGRDIIIVEDILDSGNTLAFLTEYLKTKGAASVTITTLLDKRHRQDARSAPFQGTSRTPCHRRTGLLYTKYSGTVLSSAGRTIRTFPRRISPALPSPGRRGCAFVGDGVLNVPSARRCRYPVGRGPCAPPKTHPRGGTMSPALQSVDRTKGLTRVVRPCRETDSHASDAVTGSE